VIKDRQDAYNPTEELAQQVAEAYKILVKAVVEAEKS